MLHDTDACSDLLKCIHSPLNLLLLNRALDKDDNMASKLLNGNKRPRQASLSMEEEILLSQSLLVSERGEMREDGGKEAEGIWMRRKE